MKKNKSKSLSKPKLVLLLVSAMFSYFFIESETFYTLFFIMSKLKIDLVKFLIFGALYYILSIGILILLIYLKRYFNNSKTFLNIVSTAFILILIFGIYTIGNNLSEAMIVSGIYFYLNFTIFYLFFIFLEYKIVQKFLQVYQTNYQKAVISKIHNFLSATKPFMAIFFMTFFIILIGLLHIYDKVHAANIFEVTDYLKLAKEILMLYIPIIFIAMTFEIINKKIVNIDNVQEQENKQISNSSIESKKVSSTVFFYIFTFLFTISLIILIGAILNKTLFDAKSAGATFFASLYITFYTCKWRTIIYEKTNTTNIIALFGLLGYLMSLK